MAASDYLKPMQATSSGLWQHQNPLHFSVPLLIVQILLVLIITRALALCFKPLRQPRVIGEIIGGILLGPTAFGHIRLVRENLFPVQSIAVLDSFANIGLLFFLFVVGLELDVKALKTVGSRALSIAATGMIVPFAGGAGVSLVIHKTISKEASMAPFVVFMGVAMSITAFPVLARILAELKLLGTDVGQIAMSAAAVNDVTAWILLALAVAISNNSSWDVSVWVLLSGLALVIFMVFAIRPILLWMARQTIARGGIKETHVCITFGLVLLSGLATDAIGIHLIFGGFVLGILVPKEGPFAQNLIEKLEDFISILLLPLYFASSGLKTNVSAIKSVQSLGLLVLVVVVACAGKIWGTALTAQIFVKNWTKSFTLGILMNTKGLVELIVLNIGKDKGVLSDEVFAIMVLMALITTFITTPIVLGIYHPARKVTVYSRRQLYNEQASSKDELCILSCVHSIRNIPAIMNLTEIVRGQRKGSLLKLYILHLMEFSERSSTILMVQRAKKDWSLFSNEKGDRGGNEDADGDGKTTNPIVLAFEEFESLSKVGVRTMTAISRFQDIHEDICGRAEEKRASVIILPFHNLLRLDGSFEQAKTDAFNINLRVQDSAPCSVGILVDRGPWGVSQIASSSVQQTVAVLFFGGPDDREALAFGIRMAEHPGVRVKVIHYTCGSLDRSRDIEFAPVSKKVTDHELPLSIAHAGGSDFTALEIEYSELDLQTDKGILESVRRPKLETKSLESILYEEVKMSSSGDLSRATFEICKRNEFDLILVGRGRRQLSPLLASLTHSIQPRFPELGPVGDLLTSSHCHCSVLVMQQYDPESLPFCQVGVTRNSIVSDADFEAGHSESTSPTPSSSTTSESQIDLSLNA